MEVLFIFKNFYKISGFEITIIVIIINDIFILNKLTLLISFQTPLKMPTMYKMNGFIF